MIAKCVHIGKKSKNKYVPTKWNIFNGMNIGHVIYYFIANNIIIIQQYSVDVMGVNIFN